MIHATGSIRIERPAEAIFDYVSDLRNEPEFNPDASSIVKTSPGPIGLGTVYEEDVKPLGDFVVTIDRYERPTLLGFDAKNKRADIRVRFHFTPDGAATNVRAQIEFRLRGPLRALEPLLRPMIGRVYERKRGPMLKRACEANLPAGRPET